MGPLLVLAAVTFEEWLQGIAIALGIGAFGAAVYGLAADRTTKEDREFIESMYPGMGYSMLPANTRQLKKESGSASKNEQAIRIRASAYLPEPKSWETLVGRIFLINGGKKEDVIEMLKKAGITEESSVFEFTENDKQKNYRLLLENTNGKTPSYSQAFTLCNDADVAKVLSAGPPKESTDESDDESNDESKEIVLHAAKVIAPEFVTKHNAGLENKNLAHTATIKAQEESLKDAKKILKKNAEELEKQNNDLYEAWKKDNKILHPSTVRGYKFSERLEKENASSE